MCVNNLSKVALDSAAAGIKPAISNLKSDALTTTLYWDKCLGVLSLVSYIVCEENKIRRKKSHPGFCLRDTHHIAIARRDTAVLTQNTCMPTVLLICEDGVLVCCQLSNVYVSQ